MGHEARIRTGRTARTAPAVLVARMATAAALILAATASAGCSTSEPGPEGTVEIEEVHLDAIREVVPDVEEYTKVTVPGEVKGIISPSTFSIVDPEYPLVEELLIVHETALDGISPEARVMVTGVVYRGFDVAEVEKETGIDLDQALHEQWQGDSYIVASGIEPSGASG
ncbi:hypothetical protein ACLKOZ_21630 [Arthrobacter sp. R4]|uniref:hypothetical protein n=1 Tax=Arthrobacter sp. R4 TaxID=644417 RepID=UPI003EDA1B5E